mmetsp:Transcript_14447/g.23859  ORF Transcript_14447/g.23859 Transcript_14447/m.23859 type:complete len:228 (-) Transcript_14447:58-741(-)
MGAPTPFILMKEALGPGGGKFGICLGALLGGTVRSSSWLDSDTSSSSAFSRSKGSSDKSSQFISCGDDRGRAASERTASATSRTTRCSGDNGFTGTEARGSRTKVGDIARTACCAAWLQCVVNSERSTSLSSSEGGRASDGAPRSPKLARPGSTGAAGPLDTFGEGSLSACASELRLVLPGSASAADTNAIFMAGSRLVLKLKALSSWSMESSRDKKTWTCSMARCR